MDSTTFVYMYEISDARRRNVMPTIGLCLANFGFLLTFVIGCSVPWTVAPWLLTSTTLLPGFALLLVSPESPMWLLRKGRDDQASDVLQSVRDSENEIKEEISVIKDFSAQHSGCCKQFEVLKKRGNDLSLLLTCSMILLKTLNGADIIFTFTVTIFEKMKVGLDPCWSTVLVGAVFGVFNIQVTIAVHFCNRRTLLIAGNILASLGTALWGLFVFLQTQGHDVSRLDWLPLLGATIFMAGNAGGVAMTSWTISLELLPEDIRYLGFSTCFITYAATNFVLHMLFQDAVLFLGLDAVLWLFTSASVSYALLVLFVTPESRGRSLRDIDEFWDKFNRNP